MIIVKLMGGLGNQLFQYSYGRALSIQKKEELRLDISWYRGRSSRTYLLSNFNIQAKKASFFDRIFRKKSYLIDEKGEWHSEKYFKEYADIIKKELTLKNPLSVKIQSGNSVSVHLRGGDYVTGNKSSFHGTCSREYYQKAIELIREKVPSPHFYIFTDDLPWADKLIKFPEPFTVMNGRPVEDLILMSSCKHNIIANSTFSWWAAWLNQNPTKIIVAPKKWFADEKSNSSDILPGSWISLL